MLCTDPDVAGRLRDFRLPLWSRRAIFRWRKDGTLKPTLLVVGFGRFLTVVDNPASRLARALDGRTLGSLRVVGREIPVLYEEGPALTLRWMREYAPAAVLGIGVASGRAVPMIEQQGVRQADPELEDAGGHRLGTLDPDGPETVRSTADVAALAQAIGAQISDDAGRYVCNAWLYRVVRGGGSTPVAFLHVPSEGMPLEQLAEGLTEVWGGSRRRGHDG